MSWIIHVFESKSNRIKLFMYGLNHKFRFIDSIKTESNQSKFLELFDLILNTTNIEFKC